MDRGWYARFGLVIVLTVAALFALWPTFHQWVPAPQWVRRAFPGRIAAGLDIQGGLRLSYEVEVEEAIADLRDGKIDRLKDKLGTALGITREGDVATDANRTELAQRVTIRGEQDTRIRITFQRPDDVAKLTSAIVNSVGDIRETSRDGNVVVLSLRAERLEAIRDDAVNEAGQRVDERINELGLRETTVQARPDQGDVIVEIPGRGEADFERIRNIISRTARLEFKITDDESPFVSQLTELPEGIEKRTESVSAGTRRPQVVVTYLLSTGPNARQKLEEYIASLEAAGRIPDERQLAIGRYEEPTARGAQRTNRNRQQQWRTYLLQSRAGITGESVEDASIGNDPQTQQPIVQLQFSGGTGASQFADLTGSNVKRRMAIVLDDKVESAPVINARIPGGRAQITLGSSQSYQVLLQEARDLVVVLKAGALPAPIRPSNEQLIGPSLGTDSVKDGAIGALGGVLLVLLFMALYYEVGGIIANVAVLINLALMLGMLSVLEAALTLPGIAGMALTVGMAVDANVLINERIREELRAGKSPRSAVDQGFGRAFWTIIDSHMTTFIAGVVLSQYGTGPIKGFAITLLIGIVTSVFTNVFCARVMMDWVVRGLRVQRLRVG